MELAPIVHEYRFAVSPSLAFALFTERMGEWWPASYTRNAGTFTGVSVEPFVGGRIVAKHSDGTDHEWGRITAWEPGLLLRYQSTLAQPDTSPSEITVHFHATDAGSRVLFEHGGWNPVNAPFRNKFEDWPHILKGFEQLATA